MFFSFPALFVFKGDDSSVCFTQDFKLSHVIFFAGKLIGLMNHKQKYFFLPTSFLDTLNPRSRLRHRQSLIFSRNILCDWCLMQAKPPLILQPAMQLIKCTHDGKWRNYNPKSTAKDIHFPSLLQFLYVQSSSIHPVCARFRFQMFVLKACSRISFKN